MEGFGWREASGVEDSGVWRVWGRFAAVSGFKLEWLGDRRLAP